MSLDAKDSYQIGPKKEYLVKKRIVSLFIALTLISAPPLVSASELIGEPDPHGDSVAIAWDVIVVRPVAYVAMAAAAIIYLPAALITLAGGNDIKPVQDALLKGPHDYAVKRPLGKFE